VVPVCEAGSVSDPENAWLRGSPSGVEVRVQSVPGWTGIREEASTVAWVLEGQKHRRISSSCMIVKMLVLCCEIEQWKGSGEVDDDCPREGET
jgi:hypothetical protein